MYPDLKSLLIRVGHTTEFLGIDLVDPNQRGIFGNTPLIVAITWGDHDAVRMLLNAGADANAVGEDKETPLHCAARFADAKIARLLLYKGAATDAVNDLGETPLDVARSHDKPDVAKLIESATRKRAPKVRG